MHCPAQKQSAPAAAPSATNSPPRNMSVGARPGRKLTVGATNDAVEHEADRAAESVMRMPGAQPAREGQNPAVHRKYPARESGESDFYRRASNAVQAFEAPTVVDKVLRTPGASLDAATRAFFEPRFGSDFDQVRVHTDSAAAEAASAISARAFTKGSHIAFGRGEFEPRTHTGARLLAHELAHVAQQGTVVRRQPTDDPKKASSGSKAVQPAATAPPLLSAPTSATTPEPDLPKSPCAPDPKCPADFCKPYPSKWDAKVERAASKAIILGGIALKVDSRVLPIWDLYMEGGSSLLNLSSQFGPDFTASRTTAETTQMLVFAAEQELNAHPPSFPPGQNTVSLDLWMLIGPALVDLGTKGSLYEMNFGYPSEIPGNIAGGIGDNQMSCPAGNRPSSQNDERTAHGTFEVTRNQKGTWSVVPDITYTVRDTVDLCPGDCGSRTFRALEQVATVPLSRWEATGISGDVPYEVNFPAPSRPFTIAAPPKSEPWAPGPAKTNPSPVKPTKLSMPHPSPLFSE